MGWIKDTKANIIRTDAERAMQEGRRVFACRINQGMLATNFSGSLSGVAEQIEAVEDLGWRLDQCTWAHDHKGHASAFMIFRLAR